MSLKRRDEIYNLLVKRDWSRLIEWYMNERGAVRVLMSLLYDQSPLIRWRTVEAFGIVSAELSKSEMEAVRQIIRRFFWGMNDESGNLIRNAPESIGEILFNVPSLIDEYGLVLASFQKEEPFERGVHAALARISRLQPDFLNSISENLESSFNNSDPAIKTFTFQIFKYMNIEIKDFDIKNLTADGSEFEYYNYESGLLEMVSVSDYIEKIPEQFQQNRI